MVQYSINICMIEELNKFVDLLKEKWNEKLISIVLFGSQLKNIPKEESDIDLLVIYEEFPERRLERHMVIFELAKEIDRDFAHKLSCIPLTKEEAKETKPFYLGMLTLSKIIYDRNNFFKNILTNLKLKLATLGAQRFEDKEGYEYWILKKDCKIGEPITI